MTTVLITSEIDNAKLPFNVPLGHVRSACAADLMVFSQAAEHTARLFAESWFSLFASIADSQIYVLNLNTSLVNKRGLFLSFMLYLRTRTSQRRRQFRFQFQIVRNVTLHCCLRT